MTGTFAGLPEGATVVVAGVPLTISYVGGDGNDVALVLPIPPPIPLPIPPIYAVGAGLGGQGHVKAFNAAGAEVVSFLAYPGYAGAVRVASADVNGDGAPDLITGTVQVADHVKVFDGQTGGLLFSFLAFGGYGGGIDVAAGDVDNDGFADVLVGAGPGRPAGTSRSSAGRRAP